MCTIMYGNGSYGHIITRTTNGGSSWTIVYADTSFNNSDIEHPRLRDMQYPNKNLCIVVGDSGLIIRSTDNGDTWETYRYDSLMIFTILGMYDENEGFMLGGRIDSMGMGPKTRFWRINNGGANWEEHPYPVLLFKDFTYPEIINRNLVVGNYGIKINEADSVSTDKFAFIRNDWTEFDSVVKPRFCREKHFIDEKNGWIAGNRAYKDTNTNITWYDQLIYHTSDGGKSWVKQRDTLLDNVTITKIKFYDKNFGIAGSMIRWILMTFDGGNTWNEIMALEYKSGAFNYIDHISIPPPNVAFVYSGWPDEILKWTRTPTSVVEDFNDSDILISPNPATDYVEIAIPPLGRGLGGVAPVVRVFDVLGIEVMTASIHPMTQSHRMNIENLPPGVYFVQSGNSFKRFVVMR